MNTKEAKELKRGDVVRVTKGDISFVARVTDTSEDALVFMEDLLESQGRTGIVKLK